MCDNVSSSSAVDMIKCSGAYSFVAPKLLLKVLVTVFTFDNDSSIISRLGAVSVNCLTNSSVLIAGPHHQLLKT